MNYTLFYESIIVGEVITNRSLTVDEALELLEFNEVDFMNKNGFDELDYNEFRLIDSDSLKFVKVTEKLDKPIIYVCTYKGYTIWRKSDICEYYIPQLFPYEHQKFNKLIDCSYAIDDHLSKN